MTAHDLPLARAGMDRAADERLIPGLIDDARRDLTTRVLVVRGDEAPLQRTGGLRLVGPADVPDAHEWAFLGRDDDGAAVLAAVFDADAERPAGLASSDWGMLRVVGGELDPRDAGLFVEAVSLGRWLADSPFCPACGTRTVTESAGWSRRCPNCGRQHFPRTDPAVIVAVASAGDGDRLLLGSNALWGQDRYSCFAGFGEAGESLEATVAREVREESGVELESIRYAGSQPWPYPRSLMLGFHAQARDDDAARADGEEILQVRWFTRDEIRTALAGESDVTLPGTSSIARGLIEGWLTGAGDTAA
ncbi:NAD(+) diphosphatase [Microbacterium sp. X-17]|uniref:NAD(+) diphosphatase n=1 Tax=Microbacterium sp. X-17 TaxID=3144404 RepID=UPI0031F5A577